MQGYSIEGTIGLDEKPFKKACDDAVSDAKSLKSRGDDEFGQLGDSLGKNMEKGASRAKEAIEGLKGEFGRRSLLREGLEVLAGGGAILGLGLAADQFEKLSGKIADAASEMRNGDEDWNHMAGDMARDIPIFGGVVKGFDNLREAVSGEREELAENAKFVKDWDDSVKRQMKTMEDGKRSYEEFTGVLEKLRNELELLNGTPAEKNELRIRQNFQGVMEEIQKKYYVDAGIQDNKGDPGEFTNARYELEKAIKDRDATLARKLIASQAVGKADADLETFTKSQVNIDPSINRMDRDRLTAADMQARSNYNDVVAPLDAQITKVQQLQTEYNKLSDRATELRKIYDESADSARRIYDRGVQLDKFEAAREVVKKAQEEGATYFRELREKWDDEKKLITGTIDAVGDRLRERGEKMDDEAKRLKDAIRTPEQKFSDEFKRDQELRNLGYINDDDLTRMGNRALKNFGLDRAPSDKPLDADELYGPASQTDRDTGIPQESLEQLKAIAKSLDTLANRRDDSPQLQIGVVSIP